MYTDIMKFISEYYFYIGIVLDIIFLIFMAYKDSKTDYESYIGWVFVGIFFITFFWLFIIPALLLLGAIIIPYILLVDLFTYLNERKIR